MVSGSIIAPIAAAKFSSPSTTPTALYGRRDTTRKEARKEPTREMAVQELWPMVRVAVLNSSGVTTQVAT